jgi:hypothetical protein
MAAGSGSIFTDRLCHNFLFADAFNLSSSVAARYRMKF